MYLPIFFLAASLALRKSYDFPGASEVTWLKDIILTIITDAGKTK